MRCRQLAKPVDGILEAAGRSVTGVKCACPILLDDFHGDGLMVEMPGGGKDRSGLEDWECNGKMSKLEVCRMGGGSGR